MPLDGGPTRELVDLRREHEGEGLPFPCVVHILLPLFTATIVRVVVVFVKPPNNAPIRDRLHGSILSVVAAAATAKGPERGVEPSIPEVWAALLFIVAVLPLTGGEGPQVRGAPGGGRDEGGYAHLRGAGASSAGEVGHGASPPPDVGGGGDAPEVLQSERDLEG